MEVTNRFKGLDLIDRVPEEQWTEVHNIAQEAGIKPVFLASPALQVDSLPTEPLEKPCNLINLLGRLKKCKKAKLLSEESLQIAEERREAKSKGEKER